MQMMMMMDHHPPPPSSQDAPLVLLTPARIRVLVVPVSPLRTESFRRYLDIVSRFSVINVQELTQTSQTANASTKFLDNLSAADGHMFFNFVTTHNKEHAPLEEFNLHRQIMGVIGILHCQETDSLTASAKRFQQLLQRYPSCLASRCFAFEPTASQADDTRGLVMIPNEGRLSFYLATMMNDFALDLLVAFGSLAQNIERRPAVHSPSQTLAIFSQPSISSPPTQQQILQGGPVPPPTAAYPSVGPAYTSTATSPHPPPLPAASVSTSSERDISGNIAGGAAAGGIFGGLLSSDKTKKRTPARAQKLLGDLFLMAGRLDVAISHFQAAIEMMKQNSDYMWQASALESCYTAQILLLINRAGIGPTPPTGSTESLSRSQTPPTAPSAQSVFTSQIATTNPPIRSFFTDIFERYREILNLYERAAIAAGTTTAPIVATDAALRIAQVAAEMWVYRFNGVITGGAGITTFPPSAPESASKGGGVIGADKIVLNGGMGVSRLDVNSWCVKAVLISAWDVLTIGDRVAVSVVLAGVYRRVGMKRKEGFWLRVVSRLILGSLRAKTSNAETLDAGGGVFGRRTVVEALECLKRVSEILGVHLNPLKTAGDIDSLYAPPSDDEEDWLDDFDSIDDLHNDATQSPGGPLRPKIKIRRQRFGWPELQIQTLRECIEISQTINDIPNTIRFALRLLRRMVRRLSADDQLEIADLLASLVLRTQALNAGSQQPPFADSEEPTAPVNSLADVSCSGAMSGVCGVPVLRMISSVQREARLVPLRKELREIRDGSAVSRTRDLFIFNPFAQSGGVKVRTEKKKVVFVAGESGTWEVVLANPFSFDLEVASISLRTAGVDFDADATSTIIPAKCRAHKLQLMGIPKHKGKLQILGCRVRLFGGCVEEDLIPVTKVLEDPKKVDKIGKRRGQEERQRMGKRPAVGKNVVTGRGQSTNSDDKPWSMDVEVVETLPLLDIVRDDEMTLGAKMVFDGEKSDMKIRLRNSGPININYLLVSISENLGVDAARPPNEGVEDPEDVFERDVYENSLRAFWVQTDEDDAAILRPGSSLTRVGPPSPVRVEIDLRPGQETVLRIGVYGKRWCTGGLITLDYASLSDENAAEPGDVLDGLVHIRQATVPLILTVLSPFEAVNFDVLYLRPPPGTESRENEAFSPDAGLSDVERSLSIEELLVDGAHELSPVGSKLPSLASGGLNASMAADQFLLTFDMRSLASQPFEVVFDVFDDGDESELPSSSVTAFLHPNMTKRIILPIKRFQIEDETLSKPIPTPSWKQFVVGRTTRMDVVEQRQRRQAFWLKEVMLGGVVVPPEKEDGSLLGPLGWRRGRVVARWTAGRGRWGAFDALRPMRLDLRMVRIVRDEPRRVMVDVAASKGQDESFVVEGGISGLWRVPCDAFVDVRWTLEHRGALTEDKVYMLRILPVQEFGGQNAPEFSNPIKDGRVVVNGCLKAPMRCFPGDPPPSHSIKVMFLARGRYRFLYQTRDALEGHIGGKMGDTAVAAEDSDVLWGSNEIVLEAV